MNKSKTLIWWDDEIYNSYLLCLEPYGIKLLREVVTDNVNETEITVYGPAENIDRFIEDVEDDSLEPFENISLDFEDCDEYYAELEKRIEKVIELIHIQNQEDDMSEFDLNKTTVDWSTVW